MAPFFGPRFGPRHTVSFCFGALGALGVAIFRPPKAAPRRMPGRTRSTPPGGEFEVEVEVDVDVDVGVEVEVEVEV